MVLGRALGYFQVWFSSLENSENQRVSRESKRLPQDGYRTVGRPLATAQYRVKGLDRVR